MISPLCEKAIGEALHYGNALLKFISPNDAGVTGGHQSGFYLPTAAWEMFTPHGPVKGQLTKNEVRIEWNGDLVTNSVVTWYGQGTRSEYRLTRFGKGFPYLMADTVGDLLVLIPKNISEFNAYVLDLDEDIEEIIAALGIQPFENLVVYQNGVAQVESEGECLEGQFLEFAKGYNDFPSGEVFSQTTHDILEHCVRNLGEMSLDEKLVEYYSTEYRLFQTIERQVCQTEISRLFKDVDDFLKTAGSIMNRRKSRAGRSFENHVHHILDEVGVPHEMRPKKIDGKPDVVFPSVAAYNDVSFPIEKLMILGIKTTCKDRWRQVLREGKRVPNKHIITLQPAISSNQLTEMHEAGVTLVVPKKLKREYPTDHPLEILSVEDFCEKAKTVTA